MQIHNKTYMHKHQTRASEDGPFNTALIKFKLKKGGERHIHD